MEPLNKKEMTISAAIGLFLGTVCGIMMAMSIVKENRKCEAVQQENVLLHEIVLQQQQELTNAR